MHNSPRRCRELVPTISTFVQSPSLDSVGFDGPTFRTNRSIRPSKRLQKFQTFVACSVLLGQFNQGYWLRIGGWRRHFRILPKSALTKMPKYANNKRVKLSLSAVRSRLGSGTLEWQLRRSALKVKTQAGPHGFGLRSNWEWTRLSSRCVHTAGHNQTYTAVGSFRGPLPVSSSSLFSFLVTLWLCCRAILEYLVSLFLDRQIFLCSAVQSKSNATGERL